MNPRVAGLANLYGINTRIFHMTLADLDDEHLRHQPVAGRNCPLWIAGHAVTSRVSVMRLTGADYDYPHADVFARGATNDPAGLPPLDEVIRHWDAVSEQMLARLAELDDAALDREAEGAFPGRDASVLGGLSFLAMHESYHLGQIGYLRTALGQKGIAE